MHNRKLTSLIIFLLTFILLPACQNPHPFPTQPNTKSYAETEPNININPQTGNEASDTQTVENFTTPIAADPTPQYAPIPITFTDYPALTAQMTAEEQQTFTGILPVLTEEQPFIFPNWENAEYTLYEWYHLSAYQPTEDLLLRGVYILDLDKDGTQEVVLEFYNLGGEYLVLHKEDGKIYGLELTARGFELLQKNGLFLSSGGASCTHVNRLFFDKAHFDFVEEAHACEYSDAPYEINGQAVTAEEWDKWFSENYNDMAVEYIAQPDMRKVAEAEQTLADHGIAIGSDCCIRRVTMIPSEEFLIERIWVDYLVQPENAYQHCEDYYFIYERDTRRLLWVLNDKIAEHREPLNAASFYAYMQDVNFDGKEDLIINYGYGKYDIYYRAYLQTESGFIECEDFFEKMSDYELDEAEQAIVGTYNGNGYSYRSWYHFIDGEYRCFYQEKMRVVPLLEAGMEKYYQIMLELSYDDSMNVCEAYIYPNPKWEGYLEQEGNIYAAVIPDKASDCLHVTFYEDEQFEAERYLLELSEEGAEFLLEKISFGDYNGDGYLDIGIPYSVGNSEEQYIHLLQDSGSGYFSTER